jgi:hypothetical protein
MVPPTQMLANRVENGLRHTPAGTVLITRLTKCADRVRLEVSDTGAKIPEEVRERYEARPTLNPSGFQHSPSLFVLLLVDLAAGVALL